MTARRSFVAKRREVQRQWHLVDATDKPVGRLAASIATILMGKHRPTYTPHVDTGDYVIVVNAEKVRFTGKKWQRKQYKRFSGYPSGLKLETAERVRQKRPTDILRLAVKRMLPKNKLARHMLSKLKLYAGPEHPHQAQRPQKLEIEL